VKGVYENVELVVLVDPSKEKKLRSPQVKSVFAANVAPSATSNFAGDQ